ncbi:MAG: tRNA (adenosine(37)-N6)-dimethylallyltransferase MiaA, partial [Pseudomonadota bacterium]
MPSAILIHGPTASGKTQLSLALANRLGGEIINADSMQVYRDLRVISARPSANEMQGASHHLFGHIPAHERYNTGKWLEDVGPIIADVQRRGQVPIIIGGTGLYHLALIEGLSEIPPVPEDVREEVSLLSRSGGAAALHARLSEVDSDTAARLGA